MDKSKIKLNIPEYPKKIIEMLEDNGFEAFIVGGCVRDMIMGLNPTDYDITTNAKPIDVKKIFKRTIDTGIKHGTVSVLFYENNTPLLYEVTTYRVEGDYNDSRHPSEVRFVSNLIEDLKRRDFTVNAMAYNDKLGLVDEFNGLSDLNNKIIRAVGIPYERFNEDALRILRAIRFSAKLGFQIEDDTKNSIPKLSKNLLNISKERIQVELIKTITSNNPNYINMVFDLNVAKYIAEDFDKIQPGKINCNLSTHQALSCLFYNTDIDIVRSILKELKFDNDNISKTISLLTEKNKYYTIKDIYNDNKLPKNKNDEIDILLKEIIDSTNYDLVFDLIAILKINEKELDLLKLLKDRVEYFKNNNIPIFIKDLAINGNDLIKIGYNGEEIGFILNKFKRLIHKKPQFNEKKLLQDMAKKVYNIYVEYKI